MYISFFIIFDYAAAFFIQFCMPEFIHYIVDILGRFQFEAIMNKVTMYILVSYFFLR